MKTKNKNVLDMIKPSDALQILNSLRRDPAIAKQIEEIFLNKVNEVDAESIAEEIHFDLECLEVEDLWDDSGPSQYGYNDPGDVAGEMIDEVVEPHVENMKRLHSLGMFEQEMHYCMGIVSGLYRFENDSSTPFKEWSADIPEAVANSILTGWYKNCKDPNLTREMKKFEDGGFIFDPCEDDDDESD